MINATAVEAVIFDMDGVLIDSEVVYMNRLRWFVRDFLGKQVPEERLLTMVGATGNGHFEAVREYCPPDWDIEVFRSITGNLERTNPSIIPASCSRMCFRRWNG